jgi:hypothetical protein
LRRVPIRQRPWLTWTADGTEPIATANSDCGQSGLTPKFRHDVEDAERDFCYFLNENPLVLRIETEFLPVLTANSVTVVRRAHKWWLSLAIVMPAASALSQANLLESVSPECLEAGFATDYPPLNSPPIARVVRGTADPIAPLGAACFDKTDSVVTWVTVASVVSVDQDSNALIERFGAISELLTVQYWSATDHKWRPLVLSARAAGAARSDQPRGDYSPAELTLGIDRFYLITDSRSRRTTTFRLRLLEAQRGRVIVETSNVDPIKQWGITLYAANGLDTFYFLDERSLGVWAYYSITRVLPASFLTGEYEKSLINRAVALYRHYMRLPTDADPPPAP